MHIGTAQVRLRELTDLDLFLRPIVTEIVCAEFLTVWAAVFLLDIQLHLRTLQDEFNGFSLIWKIISNLKVIYFKIPRKCLGWIPTFVNSVRTHINISLVLSIVS